MLEPSSPELVSPTIGTGSSEAVGIPTAMEPLAVTGLPGVCLLPDRPETCSENVPSLTDPSSPTAMDTPVVCLPPNKPETPPEPVFSPMGPGILVELGTPILPRDIPTIGLLFKPRHCLSWRPPKSLLSMPQAQGPAVAHLFSQGSWYHHSLGHPYQLSHSPQPWDTHTAHVLPQGPGYPRSLFYPPQACRLLPRT
ncbi:hypothetical protein P7K49_011359 [Saguinus oedipus]|uniref:Uncharacterized protein n=1 Tax=Saguinus oedipus TaxID=9490 RepID=A0ABQ9VQF9_SAGOE|nr:hypothetical protein P7K49_011359 [Saguinus oedipus]